MLLYVLWRYGYHTKLHQNIQSLTKTHPKYVWNQRWFIRYFAGGWWDTGMSSESPTYGYEMDELIKGSKITKMWNACKSTEQTGWNENGNPDLCWSWRFPAYHKLLWCTLVNSRENLEHSRTHFARVVWKRYISPRQFQAANYKWHSINQVLHILL